ncbi:MAG: hypothetical protein WAQ28_03475 [Bacteroidia bacterium]
MARPKFKIQPIALGNVTSGLTVSKNVDMDRNYRRVVGVMMTISDETGLKNTTFDEFLLNGQEIFETGFEPKLIYSTTDVAPNERAFTRGIDQKAEGNKCKFKYVDGAGAAAYPYTATVYLLLTDPIDGKPEAKKLGETDTKEE